MRCLRSGTVGVAAVLTALLLSNRCSGSLYSAAVLADGPAAYWRFNELVTTAGAFDASGFSRDGTYENIGNLTLGVPGPQPGAGFGGLGAGNTAVAFSANGHVAMPAGFLPTGSSSRTFTGWFKQTSSSAQGWLNYGRDATPNRNSITAGPNRVAVAVSGHNFGVNNLGLSDGWHHFGVIFPDGATQSNEWQFVINGVDRTQDAVTLAGSPQTVNTIDDNPLRRIGVDVNGLIDEVAVYDMALSIADIQNHYSAATSFSPGTITLDPSETVRVAWNQPVDRSTTGSDFRHSATPQDIAVRERGNPSQFSERGVTYLRFDFSDLTPAIVSGDNFFATFAIDYQARVNGLNNLQVGMDVVDDANVWTDTSGDYPMAEWVELGSADHVLVNNVFATDPPQTMFVDITEDVREWVTGAKANNGYVIFGTSNEYQGAGFANARIYAVPEPGTCLLLLLASACGLLLRRRR